MASILGSHNRAASIQAQCNHLTESTPHLGSLKETQAANQQKALAAQKDFGKHLRQAIQKQKALAAPVSLLEKEIKLLESRVEHSLELRNLLDRVQQRIHGLNTLSKMAFLSDAAMDRQLEEIKQLNSKIAEVTKENDASEKMAEELKQMLVAEDTSEESDPTISLEHEEAAIASPIAPQNIDASLPAVDEEDLYDEYYPGRYYRTQTIKKEPLQPPLPVEAHSIENEHDRILQEHDAHYHRYSYYPAKDPVISSDFEIVNWIKQTGILSLTASWKALITDSSSKSGP